MSEQEVKFEISPAKINECLKSYSLKGKRLKNILIDSTIFNFGEESLCSTVYDSLIRIYGEEYSQKIPILRILMVTFFLRDGLKLIMMLYSFLMMEHVWCLCVPYIRNTQLGLLNLTKAYWMKKIFLM